MSQIEAEENGRTYVLCDGDHILALVGCYTATDEMPFNVVSTVHVNPKHRRCGHGRCAIQEMISVVGGGVGWKVYIEEGNTKMISLIESMDWILVESGVDGDGFVTYEQDAKLY